MLLLLLLLLLVVSLLWVEEAVRVSDGAEGA